MSAVRGRRLVRTLVIVAGALLLLILAVQFWLSSGLGRGVVESRLSAALGRPARLDGAFSLRLLPVPGVTGTDLKVFTRDGRWLLVDAGDYLVRLALWPLLTGDVQIVALRIDAAAVDVQRLAAEPPAAAAPDGAEFFAAVPDIGSFDLAGVALYFDGIGSEPYVRIDNLSVEEFTIDSPAAFEIGLALVSGDSELIGLFADGTLILHSVDVVQVDFSRLDAALAEWDVRGISGELTAGFGQSTLAIGLQWNDSEQRVRLGSTIDWDPGYAAAIGGYAIDEVELVLDDQRIGGRGCLLDDSPPRLNLELAAAVLDIEALAALAEKWRVPRAGPVEVVESGRVGTTSGGTTTDELPVSLAVRLLVERATYGDVVATGARLNVGDPPGCPQTR